MKLKKIQLENFRNYKRYSFLFPKDKDLTVIVGPNGVGKTNLLEAIYVLSLGRSFRTLYKDELIEWKMDYMRCQGQIENENETETLEVFYSNYPRKQRSFKINDAKLKNSEYLGNLLTVLFYPEDLNMLYLSPIYRRKYINILLSQTDRNYLEALINYKKILKQRNALLAEINHGRFKNQNTASLEADLSAWDEKIIENGIYIIQKRFELAEFLNKHLEGHYNAISDGRENIKVKYINNISAELYKQKLSEKREKDIKESKTTIGPHLDDLVFYINDKEITVSASRGEFRTLLLAIKLAEIDYIKQKTKKNPILLLDDVFSELDRKRQTHLLKSIKGCQTIISTTDIGNIKKLAKESHSIGIVKLK